MACGHPPLYYALAALWSKVMLLGGWIPFELELQWLSLLLFFGFVIPVGEQLRSGRHKALAVLIRLQLLAMVAVCMVAPPFMREVHFRRYRAYLGAAVIMFIFLVAFRIRPPNQFREDFRHSFPALVPFCLSYATIVERLGRVSRVLHQAGIAIGLLMVTSPVVSFARIP
jgi:hypothetical protein